MLNSINTIITDGSVLTQRYIIREGFIFTAIMHPANIYDAIVIRCPHDAECYSPRIGISEKKLQEHIDFINHYGITKALIISNDIGFITLCPSLKHLRVIPADTAGDGFDFSPLYEMPTIKSLQCETIYGPRDEFTTTIDCSRIKGVESLAVNNASYKNFQSVKTLKSLGLSGYPETDLNNAFSSVVLDTLTVIQCKVRTLEGIQISKELQCLYLYNNRSLYDITALKTVSQSLKSLRIDNCPKINDFSVLAELENLELLELSGNNTLPNLDFLKGMKSLKTFIFSMNVLDGDLSLCSHLSYVYSLKNRKHYNIKDSNLPKGMYVHGNETIEIWRRLE